MNTDQLRLFLVIAQHRSLSRAAAELDLGQATVSDRLHALEAELGAPLFERHGRGVVLTPAGESFRPYAERALEVLREAQDSVRGAKEGERGQVSIAVTVTSGAYLFAPALVAFQREHPNVEVRVRSAHSWDAPGLILDGVAQLAIISGPSLNPQIESLATFTSPLVLVSGKQHSLALDHLTLKHLTLEHLSKEQLLISYWGPASQAFIERIRAAAPEGKTGLWLELSPVELVKGMLLAGTGVSLVPEIAVRRELAAGELISLHLADPEIRLPVWEINLIRHRRRPPNPAADALAETLIRVLPTLT
jgi:DNA-binding transcriptional LysR family regulator